MQGGPGWRVPTQLEWIPEGFQLQDRCWEEAGTGAGDGDTRPGVGWVPPAPRVSPITPGLCPRLCPRQRQNPAGWTLGTEPPACPGLSSDPETPLLLLHSLDVLEGQGQEAFPRRMVTGNLDKAGREWQ